jgi:hypothetical protein
VEKPALKVHVRISPPPEELTRQQLDALMDGELIEFEKHLMHKQHQAGFSPEPLSTPERGILKGFLVYAASKEMT